MNNKYIKLGITILFGWLGIHKFIEKKNGLGIVYFFTMGLFGIGWIVDIIDYINDLKGDTNSNINKTIIKIKDLDAENTFNAGMDNKKSSNISNEVKENYRKTIFLYAESHVTKVKSREDYVRYLSYECGIINPEIYHKQLISEGYYQKAKAEEILELFKVDELKDILIKNNLITKGKKAELIKQILENIPNDEIIKSDQEYYSLSDKGKEFLEIHKNYVELHRYKDYQITLEDYCTATKNDKYKRKFNDVAWQIFNERTLLYQKNQAYGDLRYNFFHMANLLMRENRKKYAIRFYLECLIIDLSGVESIDAIRSYKSGWCNKKEFLERLEYNNLIPSLINQIIELKEYYDETMLVEAYHEIYLPFNVSTIEDIKVLIEDAFNSAVFDFDKYRDSLIARKKKKYLQMI